MSRVSAKLAIFGVVPMLMLASLAGSLYQTSQASALRPVSSNSAVKNQGVTGQITVGPTSPFCGDASPCYMPYQTTMSVFNNAGKVVATFSSDSQGFFSASLTPGNYTIEQPNGGNVFRLPYTAPQAVKVVSGQYTYVSFQFDSSRR
jgi:hypothetical protein